MCCQIFHFWGSLEKLFKFEAIKGGVLLKVRGKSTVRYGGSLSLQTPYFWGVTPPPKGGVPQSTGAAARVRSSQNFAFFKKVKKYGVRGDLRENNFSAMGAALLVVR